MKIVALVGLAGAGKTEAAKIFKEHNYEYVRFGQAVLDEVMRRGLEVNEQNERMVREDMRAKHGMAAMAIYLLPVFDKLIKATNVVADGLYSWEEYILLKEKYKDNIVVLAIYASPKIRYKRLTNREFDSKKDPKAIYRSYTSEEAYSRDKAQIENLHQAGPIAMADYTIINEKTKTELINNIKRFLYIYFPS